MQRARSVKIKEVIESLCKLISALGVESVPGTDTFRRAKFNKGDAVEDLWRLLYCLLSKAIRWECACQTTKIDVGAQARLVCIVLRQFGYGAPWLGRVRDEGGHGEQVGSRDLLLALGWAISSGGLLESLLGEQTEGLETLTTLPRVPDCGPLVELPSGAGRHGGDSEQEAELRRLRWEQGKLRILWSSLWAAQAERAGLLHQVLSSTSGPMDTYPVTDQAGHSKELEQLRADIQVLEIYLDWKQMEPLFWCWMESVIETELAEPSPPWHTGAVAMALKNVVVKGARCHSDSRRRATDKLSEMLLMLQVQLQAWRAVLVDHASWSEDMISSSEKMKIQERVKLRLCSLAEVYASQPTCRRYRLRPPHRPTKRSPSQARQLTEAQASSLIEELREEEVCVRQEVMRLRRGLREELQELASRMDGVVLIPPLKR